MSRRDGLAENCTGEPPMHKRELAAKIVDNPLARTLWRAAAPFRKGLRILAYHRVLNFDARSFPFDEDVISASSEAFRQQMRFAQKNFDIISFADLRQCELEDRPYPNRALIVTFDDGYRDNYTCAYPILKEFRLPATIFLVTGHIGRSKLFWWDAVAYCVKNTPRAVIELPEISPQKLRLDSAEDRAFAIHLILGWIKHVPDDVSRRFVSRLPEELGVEMPEGVAEGMHLSWDEVREMAENGIEFGSHTVSHPILANVSEEHLERELLESKKTIERELGREVLTLAYPVGRRSKFNQLAQTLAAKHGFRFAVSYEEGVVSPKGFDRYAMPRIHVEAAYDRSLFRANLMFPDLMLGKSQWPHLALEYQAALKMTTKEISQGS